MKWNVPNILTLIRMILIPFFVLFYFTDLPHWNIWSAIIFIVAAVTDWLDGYLARKNNQVSNFGKLWDPIADKLLVLAALLLLMDWGKVGFIAVLILEARELLIGGMRSVAASKGVVIAADKSGKLKTVVQFIAIILLLLNDWPFMFVPVSIGTILIWVSVVLSVYSCIEYFVKNRSVFTD
ncbi:CDP-diacylglycerol--glycerol-3-phosphate 3-phosphatidyltransferase [Christensenella tenuis]|uniref:CDP-diacylglycerol--glycerol-3-phosphate 3-phosphatidyltransferase n=1 Tax=Christensenella tenuis TaxID=2763033 RepID=A0ABR7EC47_9FIRM|nr:CDP-diacylglycerol--glycerol-3-phosphate 3-phosphatidyltransferase [Christensenella tenuis]MBC5647213.1 CDP-diacylglycerol--glycerol-3-phosphate 3-phosphatidyltransferase [Christensenella tenuis]